MKAKFRKWSPLVALGLFLVVVVIFILTAGKEDPSEAHYVQGVNELTLNGVSFTLINDIEAETYIGSMVSDVLKGCRGERVGAIESYGIMTVAVLYAVEGDARNRYLVDSKDRLYVRTDLLEETRAMLSKEESFSVFRIVGKDKDMKSLKDLEKEDVEEIFRMAKEGTEVTINATKVVTDYNNRREVFAFTEDRTLYRAALELFLYNNEVYVTTFFEGNEDKLQKQTLKGVKLTEGLREKLLGMWD